MLNILIKHKWELNCLADLDKTWSNMKCSPCKLYWISRLSDLVLSRTSYFLMSTSYAVFVIFPLNKEIWFFPVWYMKRKINKVAKKSFFFLSIPFTALFITWRQWRFYDQCRTNTRTTDISYEVFSYMDETGSIFNCSLQIMPK
jgi:hypothetical protein